MRNNSIYSLEKHKNGKKKYVCPKCLKRTLVRYINNETNEYLHDDSGRCDKEDSCGYHYPPKDYFRDHPTNTTYHSYNHSNNKYPYNRMSRKPYRPIRTFVPQRISTNGTNDTKAEIQTIPFKYIEQAAQTRNSTLIEYFFTLFSWETICNTVDKYFIGCTKDREVIYPQIDANGKVRSAKIQQYNLETGKRIKDKNINWIHSILKRKGLLPEDFTLTMCLFGEHLIRSERYKNMPVCIVESEKTALIGAGYRPDYLWMASGALGWLNVDKLKPLKGRKITLFPDTSKNGNAFKKWSKIADEAKRLGYDIRVSNVLENICTNEQKAAGYDLGDYFIDEIKKEQRESPKPIQADNLSYILSDMINGNPAVANLIDSFDLVEV